MYLLLIQKATYRDSRSVVITPVAVNSSPAVAVSLAMAFTPAVATDLLQLFDFLLYIAFLSERCGAREAMTQYSHRNILTGNGIEL